jgi:hypothetical protein
MHAHVRACGTVRCMCMACIAPHRSRCALVATYVYFRGLAQFQDRRDRTPRRQVLPHRGTECRSWTENQHTSPYYEPRWPPGVPASRMPSCSPRTCRFGAHGSSTSWAARPRATSSLCTRTMHRQACSVPSQRRRARAFPFPSCRPIRRYRGS